MFLTVLHTGKRWFIICPVAETPLLDDEKPTSNSATAQGMFHIDIFYCMIIIFTVLYIHKSTFSPHSVLTVL